MIDFPATYDPGFPHALVSAQQNLDGDYVERHTRRGWLLVSEERCLDDVRDLVTMIGIAGMRVKSVSLFIEPELSRPKSLRVRPVFNFVEWSWAAWQESSP